ncbi:MAG TPA: hypothetical protein PKG88_02495 [Bacteroidales bacterium]|nr:hypothetical protein [Bacteroidales bacterium]HPS71128.1 hypothetical protein [Bacteroidales bacterium]
MIIYKKLHKKTFQTYFKNDSGSSIIQEYKLKLHYDSVSYTGSNLLEPDSSFVGKIKFEPKMKGFGRGYSIKKINGKDDGFNFFTIFFEGDFTVAYQEAPYVKSPKEITQRAYIPEAFVWKEKKVDQKLSKIKKLKKSINA